eukprot:754576-Hanusia_phi.AAC.6
MAGWSRREVRHAAAAGPGERHMLSDSLHSSTSSSPPLMLFPSQGSAASAAPHHHQRISAPEDCGMSERRGLAMHQEGTVRENSRTNRNCDPCDRYDTMDYMGNPLADSSDQGGCNVTGTRCLGLRTNRPSYLLLTHMFILICAFTSVTASELQYATIRYSQEMGNVVKFVIPMQWRRTVEFTTIQKGEVVDVVGTAGVGSGPVVFNPGYGPTHRIQMFVLDVGMDYVFGEAYFTLASYPSLNNNGAPWVATLQGCCLPCSYSHFNLTANVDLLNAPSSSAFKSLPTVYVQGGVTSIINLPANTPGGVNSPFWRLGQGLEVSQLFIDRNVFFFDGPDYLQGRLTANFSVSNPALQGSCQDSFSVIAQTLSVPGFMVPLLFIVKTVPQADWIKRPTILSPTVSSLNGYVGYDVFFTISATSANPGTVGTLQSSRSRS